MKLSEPVHEPAKAAIHAAVAAVKPDAEPEIEAPASPEVAALPAEVEEPGPREPGE